MRRALETGALVVIVAVALTVAAASMVEAFDSTAKDALRPPQSTSTSLPEPFDAPLVQVSRATTTVPTSTSTTVALEQSWPWPQLADCESGEWDAHARPIAGTRRWNDMRGGYEGGLHFAPSTWDTYKPAGWPESAAAATPAQQVSVAVRVRDGVRESGLRGQGYAAWPTCSRKVGAR